LSDFQVQLQVSDKNYILNIEALRAEGGLLHAPYKNHMLTRISETLSSQVKIELFHRQKNSSQLIFSGEGNPAGLDVNGILKDIIDT